MKLNIENVTDSSVTVNAQPLARPYVEEVLFPLMVATQGQNETKVVHIAEAFDAAGLSLAAAPSALRTLREYQQEQRIREEKARQEAAWHEERCRIPTLEEIAQKRAERASRDAAIRAHGERIRAANRGL